jgi:ligand-binding sensor domain-containing protein
MLTSPTKSLLRNLFFAPLRLCAKLKSRKGAGGPWAAFGVVILAGALWGYVSVRRAIQGLEQARSRVEARDAVRFERRRMEPLKRDGVRLLQSTRSTRAVARFRDSYFAATDGGLVQLSPSGEVVKRFSVLDGLPESDLTCLAAYGARLYAGTRSKGLVAFDGENFERFWWPDRDAQAVTSLLEDRGKLLVGTFAGGLLEFDGDGFKELRAGERGERIEGVTTLARYGPRLYAGTFAKGLWVSEGGRWAHFTSADGLKSDRVVAVVECGEQTFVASDFGLAAARAEGLVLNPEAAGKWRDVATVPALSAAVAVSNQILLCKDGGEFALLDSSQGRTANRRTEEFNWLGVAPRSQPQSGAVLSMLDGYVWLLGGAGIRRAAIGQANDSRAGETSARARESSRLTFAEFGEQDSRQSPASNIISALALDAGGNLWAGSFRNGLDVFSPSGVRLTHVEADDLREVNALAADTEGGMFAATSQGLVRFDSALRSTRMGAGEGLAGNSVLHVALPNVAPQGDVSKTEASRAQAKSTNDRQLIVATSRGLSLGAAGKMRTLTTVQGLPSNSVYTVWSAGERVFAGTLGGLAELSGGRVVRVFKDSNSALKNNWVTAVCGAGGRLFVGTYGGGVFELMPSGELRSFAQETGAAFVNANAMWGDAERLYVGTLDGALVFDLRSQKWTRLRDELPSQTVLSVAGRGGEVFFGTTGGLARFDASFFESAEFTSAEFNSAGLKSAD